ncbi:MAG: type II toxin-antitoxin system RelE/ParE family toxin [Clostridia bacterium]|nr:type II toxin-antitoxin system RelE/ParE family toxin [Clostridia bacterium]
MAYNLFISENADADVDGIVAYISTELHNPDAAAGFLDRLSLCYDRLEANPMLYALTSHPVFQTLSIRRAPIGGYGVFYRVMGDDVQVVRVLSDLEALEGKL